MRIAIHQPEFMPWPGFFDKMARCDLYVVLDHVQFKKRYFENRNQLVSPKGEVFYIGPPVISKGRYTQSIRGVEIDNTRRWQDKLLKNIEYNYRKAPYFAEYYEGLRQAIGGPVPHQYLMELNLELITFFRTNLGITTPILFSSAMDVKHYKASELILEICVLNGASTYLCGASGRNYLNIEDFARKKVHIEWLDYKPPMYKQLCKEFVPNMSTLDILFNYGKNSLELLMGMERKQERRAYRQHVYTGTERF